MLGSSSRAQLLEPRSLDLLPQHEAQDQQRPVRYNVARRGVERVAERRRIQVLYFVPREHQKCLHSNRNHSRDHPLSLREAAEDVRGAELRAHEAALQILPQEHPQSAVIEAVHPVGAQAADPAVGAEAAGVREEQDEQAVP